MTATGAPPELRELYLATHRRLVAAVAAVTGDLAEAEACVQEAFARAIPRWRRIARYDDPEAWVRLVATNVAWSRFRQRRAAASRERGTGFVIPPLSEDHGLSGYPGAAPRGRRGEAPS